MYGRDGGTAPVRLAALELYLRGILRAWGAMVRSKRAARLRPTQKSFRIMHASCLDRRSRVDRPHSKI